MVLPDRRIAVAGRANRLTGGPTFFAIARYAATGELDLSFSADGLRRIEFGSGESEAHGVELQPDGRLVVAGEGPNSSLASARLHGSGALDSSYGTGGRVLTPLRGRPFSSGEGLALAPDGRIVIAGTASNDDERYVAVARLEGG